MNSSRTRYASTPTYGMQKRGFKKQSSITVAEAPDFSQQPAQPEPMMPGGAPMVAQNGVPFSTPYLQQSLPFLQPGAAPAYPPQPFYPGALPQAGAPMAGMPNSISGYSPLLPTQTAIPATQSPAELPFNQQGYIPQTQQPILGNTVIPAVAYGQPPLGPGFVQQPIPMPPMQPGIMPDVPPMSGAAFSPAMSGSPVMMGMQQPMGAPMQPSYNSMQPPTSPRQRQPINKDMLAKLFIFAFLPLLFVVSLLLPQFVFLKYVFLILAVLTVGAIWYLQLFSSCTRASFSIVAGALVLAVIVTLSGGKDGKISSAISLDPPSSAAQQVSTPSEPLPPDIEPEPLTEPEPDSFQMTSEAERRLSAFMDLWEAGLTSDMVDLVMPSWTSTKDDPASELFTTVLNNRTPTEYAIESIDGNEADSARTIIMAASISKNNGKDPIRYRFRVLMVKEDSLWYVDPNSLASNEATEAASTKPVTEPTLNQDAPRTTVTPVPDASTKLYYNATGGGKYYHIDPECSSVNTKWLPLDSFLYSQLGEAPYKSLIPCLKCGAPAEAK